jgi:hypothetical protein
VAVGGRCAAVDDGRGPRLGKPHQRLAGELAFARHAPIALGPFPKEESSEKELSDGTSQDERIPGAGRGVVEKEKRV